MGEEEENTLNHRFYKLFLILNLDGSVAQPGKLENKNFP